MTDDRHERRPSWTPRSNRLLGEAAGEAAALAPAPREALDREEDLIRDAVLRMGTLVEAAIREASRALVAHDAALALDVIKGDAIINEAQRAVSRLISVTIATQQPVARDLRYLLTLDHVTYELERMGDHAASVAKQVIKLAPEPPLQELRPPARDGRARRRPRPRRAARARRSRTPSRPARSRSRTTRSTGCTTRRSTRSSS